MISFVILIIPRIHEILFTLWFAEIAVRHHQIPVDFLHHHILGCIEAVLAIGQGNTVISPIHAAMLVSAIANGGTLMKPYVIDSVQSTEGSVIEQYESENYGTLMSASESSQLTKMMKAVVEEGTGYKLSGKNYSVAGKTGTAEVVGRGNNAWFVGFAPADDPKIAICVLVEDAGTASSEAVPIAGEILDASACILRLRTTA